MLKIINGQVYDPLHGLKGEVRDIYIEEGKVVEDLSLEAQQVIDAKGCAVMPGGVEIHSHIAGAKVNSARSMCPEDHYDHFKEGSGPIRSGTGYTLPTTFMTGYNYACLGYTTAFEAAVPVLEARHAHEELKDTPILDTGFYTLMGNNHLLMKVLSEKDGPAKEERLQNLVTWLLTSSKGYAVKVVNPGGVESWKWGKGAVDLDTAVEPFGVTPRDILLGLVKAISALKLPHGLHLHANHLGEPGNFKTTLETMYALEGFPVHFTHLQFHSYGMTKRGGLQSAAQEIAEYMNRHPEFTFDVGQLVFGPVTTMTSDSPMQFRLHQMTGNKWISADVEMETGGGIVPLVYKGKNLFNAIQWCIGLELLLLTKNPWQVTLTTDHPNAGPFTAYPHIIRLLMDCDFRNEILESLPQQVARYTNLKDIKREYSLDEIAIITRGGPAKTLGLKQKGHLGVGADADVAIYRIQENKEAMFSSPLYVLKEGQVVVKDAKVLQNLDGKRFMVEPDGSKDLPADLAGEFAKYYTIALANYAVEDAYVLRPEVITCS